MRCIACEVKFLENSVAVMDCDYRVVETLEWDPEQQKHIANVFSVPANVSIDKAVKKQFNEEFREQYWLTSYEAGTKIHTCNN